MKQLFDHIDHLIEINALLIFWGKVTTIYWLMICIRYLIYVVWRLWKLVSYSWVISTKFQQDIYQIVKCTVKSQLSRLVNMTMQLYKKDLFSDSYMRYNKCLLVFVMTSFHLFFLLSLLTSVNKNTGKIYNFIIH